MESYRLKKKLKKKDLAAEFGVTKGYISQIMNGNFDHKMSKLVELSLACGKVPQIIFVDLEEYIKNDLASNSDGSQQYDKTMHYPLTLNSESAAEVAREDNPDKD
jgi:transcriptional regulator with XRE-family HTH domain